MTAGTAQDLLDLFYQERQEEDYKKYKQQKVRDHYYSFIRIRLLQRT
jgi:hypothetical protein